MPSFSGALVRSLYGYRSLKDFKPSILITTTMFTATSRCSKLVRKVQLKNSFSLDSTLDQEANLGLSVTVTCTVLPSTS